ncbi:hypothetical protein Daus18300_009506 [Diaporthe australafricana]|uniref:Heterokaryon incompatibility domain-containing protein n=1 Tax=Diaporthe australafricana TaxID=127596 RepID=A0ABR3WDV1_9PEZI
MRIFSIASASLAVGALAANYQLPETSGPFPVGTVSFELVDDSRTDPLAPNLQNRDLMISLYYPTDTAACKNISFAPAFPPQTAAGFDVYAGVPTGTGASIISRSYLNAPLVDSELPILIFGHGLGGSRLIYAAQLEDLASQGWIIVAVDHTYDAIAVEFPDGRLVPTRVPAEPDLEYLELVLETRVADVKFVLDSLDNSTLLEQIPGLGKGNAKLKTDTVGIFGHSYGGATAAQAMLNYYSSFACGANFDGSIYGPVVNSGIEGPFLLMAAQNHTRGNDPSWAEFWEHLPGFKRQFNVNGTVHVTFEDMIFYRDLLGDIFPADQRDVYGSIAGDRLLQIETELTDAFFGFCLKASLSTGISLLKRKHSLSNDGDSDSDNGEGGHTTSSEKKRKGKRPAKYPVLDKLGTGVEGSEFAGRVELDDFWVDVQDSEPDDDEPARNPSVEAGDFNSDISAIRSDDSDWQNQPTRQSRRTDIVWPTYPSRSTQCCDTCNAMTGTAAGLRALLNPRGYRHLNWYDLQETASMGCALCQAIWDVTEHDDWDFEEDGLVVLDEIRITGSFSELVDIEGGPPPEHPMTGRFFDEIAVHIPQDGGRHSPPYGEGEVWHLVTFDGDPACSVVPGRRECKDLTSMMASKIRWWLNGCQDNHRECPRRHNHPLPRMIIDLESPMLRLYLSGPDEKGSYATLSYCWGGVAQLTTTVSNLQDHLQSIDPTRLPKTITDAIDVCRAIGLRYLWVDALCIVQDNDDEKQEEIANMGLIYKDSVVTIVAASAAKVSDGFLGKGKPEEPGAQLPLYIDKTTTGTIYLRMKNASETYTSHEPIFQRGWTYQELVLSSRTIIFDSSQITLKCLTTFYRPVTRTYLDPQVDPPELPVGVFGMVDENLASRETRESRDDYINMRQNYIWKAIVHNYSDRELSSFADRLPALAGIATELAAVWDDTYLAGFWRRTIMQSLGWHRTDRRRRFDYNPPRDLFEGVVDRARRTESPTWSWVTAPYPVRIEEVRNPDSRLVDSGVQPMSKRSPFGQVRSAYIALEARVLDVAPALGPDVEFQTWRARQSMWPRHDDGILLDFEEPKPEIEKF